VEVFIAELAAPLLTTGLQVRTRLLELVVVVVMAEVFLQQVVLDPKVLAVAAFQETEVMHLTIISAVASHLLTADVVATAAVAELEALVAVVQPTVTAMAVAAAVAIQAAVVAALLETVVVV
jgi:hypothetical protein